MQYIYQFASEHPFLFTLIMIYVSNWRPIRITKHYAKPPDEYKID